MAHYSTLHLKAVENKGNLKPKTDVSKSKEYEKYYQVKKKIK